MLYNIKHALSLHCVFHGIRFKVNFKDWVVVRQPFLFLKLAINICDNIL